MKGGDLSVVGNIEKRGENSYRLRVSRGYSGEGKRITYKKNNTSQKQNRSTKRISTIYIRNRNRTSTISKKDAFKRLCRILNKQLCNSELIYKDL